MELLSMLVVGFFYR